MNKLTSKEFLESFGTSSRGNDGLVEAVARLMCAINQPASDPDSMGPLPRGLEDGNLYPLWMRNYGTAASAVVGFISLNKIEPLMDEIELCVEVLLKHGGVPGNDFVRWNYPDLWKEKTNASKR